MLSNLNADILNELTRVIMEDAEAVRQSGAYPVNSIALLSELEMMGTLVSKSNEPSFEGWRTFIDNTIFISNMCPSLGVIYVMHSVATHSISHGASVRLRDEVVSQLANGKLIGCLAIADDPSDPLQSVFHIDGETLNGTKKFCSGIHYADVIVAEYLQSGMQRAYVVYANEAGVRISENRWHGMGLAGQDSCSVHFDDIPVEPSRKLQGENQPKFMKFLPKPRRFSLHSLGFAAIAVGASGGMLDIVTAVVREKGYRFVQAHAHSLGDLYSEFEASLGLIERALTALERQDLRTLEFCEMAKVFACRSAQRIAQECLKVGGSRLYAQEKQFQMLYADVQGLPLLGPSHDLVCRNIGLNTLEEVYKKRFNPSILESCSLNLTRS